MTIKQQILNTISNHIDKQTEKGMSTYGQSLDDCHIDKYDWQNMIIEELIDALQYQQKEIARLRGTEEHLNVIDAISETYRIEVSD